MTLHRASGRWRLGLGLSAATAVFWATLPLALKLSLEHVDAITLTWFRFVVAALATGLWLGWRGQLRSYASLGNRQRGWLALAAAMLLGNYVFYLLGVRDTSPANAQLLIQLAPLLMALGGILVFGERFGRAQWLGMALLALGLWLFFDDQRQRSMSADYGTGSAWVILAAVVWAVYALLQKQLLMRLSAMQIMCAIYVLAALALTPFAQPRALLALDPLHVALVLYCAANTIAAYGAFAEALAHWEASRVSAILALTPLLCIATIAMAHALWPQLVAAERIGSIGYLGAGLVIVGSLTVSLLGRRKTRE